MTARVPRRRGDVLVTGGETGLGEATTSERYRPAEKRWVTAPAMPSGGRTRQAAALLLDGRVLLCGGQQGIAPLATCVAFDPAAGVVARPALSGAGLDSQQRVVVSGSGFRPPAGASSDGTNSSATNGPLLQLRHVDSGRLLWAGQDGAVPGTDEGMTSAPVTAAPAFGNGPVLATIFVNGVPSSARLVGAQAPPQAAQRLYLPAVSRLP